MSRRRTSVAQLAAEASLEVDEALIILWDAGFDSITGPGDLLPRGDANRARRHLGVATRRELASHEYWQGVLDLDQPAFVALLAELGIGEREVGPPLTKRAIRRLSAEQRGRTAPVMPPQGIRSDEVPQPEAARLEWRPVGHERPCRYLTDEEVLAIHYELVADFRTSPDPVEPPGVRSQALLSSAVARPLTSLDGVLKYPTIEMAAAALLHAVVHDHPFHNGNKRTALVAMLVFLDENGLVLTCSEDALFKTVLQLAQHALTSGPRNELPDREVIHVARWIVQNSRLVEKGDRPIPWRKLKQILKRYDCTFEYPTAGNRINVSRIVVRPSRFLGRPKEKTLRMQTHYADEGREVARNTINDIRHKMELDDDHGIDSATFYHEDDIAAGEFIVRYRKTLRRLAKL